MSTRDYGIRYTVDGAETSRQMVAALKAEILSLAAANNSGKGSVRDLLKVDSGSLDKAATALGTIGATAGPVQKTADALLSIWSVTPRLKDDLAAVARSLRAIGETNGRVALVGASLSAINERGHAAIGTAEGLSSALRGVADRRAGLGETERAVTGIQRHLFGANKNAEELNAALLSTGAAASGLSSAAAPIQAVGAGARGARGALRGAGGAARKLNGSLLRLAGGISALSAARTAAMAVGDAINSARETSDKEADKAIGLRDRLREVANLQGKAAPDNATVEGLLRLRTGSGMSTSDADAFLRKFYGSIEAGKGKGNITDAISDQLQPIAGATGVRTGMAVGTAGDLAASLANYGKISSARQAAGQMGTVVDQLNKGRGDLTPLTESLLKTAGTTVGPKGSAFANLPELAAALGVASNSASPAAAGTMIQQTMRGLSMSGKDSDETLKKYGITGSDNFETRVRKIKPFIDDAEKRGVNPMDALKDAGFGNITDRRGIVYFARNQALLSQRMGEVGQAAGRDGTFEGAGDETIAKNAAFNATDVGRDRVAKAQVDAANDRRYRDDAARQTRRKEAEASLILQGKLNTAGSGIRDSIGDLFGLATSLGKKSSRQMRIDQEANRLAGRDAEDYGPRGKASGADGEQTALMKAQLEEMRKMNEHMGKPEALPPRRPVEGIR